LVSEQGEKAMNGKAIVELTGGSRLPAEEASAFGVLMLAERRTLLGYANMLTGDRASADDLVQDTFERALRGARQFRAGSNLTAWLRRIMRNLFTDRCRQGTRFVSMANQDLADCAGAETPPDQPREIDCREFLTMEDVNAALEVIDEAAREVFVLAHLQRRSYQEIAATLGIPVSTVGTRLWRARARIRQVLVQTTWPRPADDEGAPAQSVSRGQDSIAQSVPLPPPATAMSSAADSAAVFADVECCSSPVWIRRFDEASGASALPGFDFHGRRSALR
jgi:RNA polymerase sigma-70 factor (ECF subfamily)